MQLGIQDMQRSNFNALTIEVHYVILLFIARSEKFFHLRFWLLFKKVWYISTRHSPPLICSWVSHLLERLCLLGFVHHLLLLTLFAMVC